MESEWLRCFGDPSLRAVDFSIRCPVDPVTGIRTATPYIPRERQFETIIPSRGSVTNNVAISGVTKRANPRFGIPYVSKGIVRPPVGNEQFNITVGYNLPLSWGFESNLNYNHQYTPNFPDVQYGPNSMIYNIDIGRVPIGISNDLKANMWQPVSGRPATETSNITATTIPGCWPGSGPGATTRRISRIRCIKIHLNSGWKPSVRSQITSWDLFRNEKFPYSADVYDASKSKATTGKTG